MGNFKVRVNNKAESKEAMNLLDKAGYTKGTIDNISKPCWIAVLDGKQYSDYMLSKSIWYTANPKEITLAELRTMVRPMKEYLNKNTYEYKLACSKPNGEWVRIPKNANYAGSVGHGVFFSEEKELMPKHVVWVRPAQPEALPSIGDNPQSINDQYAEIEQVRQENVSNPSHYTQGKVECIDALESATIGKSGIEAVCVANVIKYLWRYEEKNGLEDVKKAQWYLERLVASMDS